MSVEPQEGGGLSCLAALENPSPPSCFLAVLCLKTSLLACSAVDIAFCCFIKNAHPGIFNEQDSEMLS